MSGIAQVRAGRIDQARLHLEMQGRLFNSAVEPENWWHNALAGEIALAAGDLEKAASAFSAGQPSKKMWFSTRYASLSILANNVMSRDGLARVAQRREGISPARFRSIANCCPMGPIRNGCRCSSRDMCSRSPGCSSSREIRPAALEAYERFLDYLEARRFRLGGDRRGATSRGAALISRTGGAMTIFSRSPFG